MASRMGRPLGRISRAVLILAIALMGDPATLRAQAPPLPASAIGTVAIADSEPSPVRLLVGRSTVVDVGQSIMRVSLTSADVADALVTSSSQLLINGKAPGTISMFVWERSGAIRRYEVNVQRDLSRLSDQIRQLFPGESIGVQSNGKDIVLSGLVSSKDVIDKAMDLASGYVDKRDEVVSLLRLQEAGASNQVLLRVRFAEVSRSVLTELGVSLFSDGYKNYIGRSSTQQFPAPFFDVKNKTVGSDLVFSDYLNFFLFSGKDQLGAVIKALQTRGMFNSLAEPNLVAESGKEASFLAGGEFPIPIAQPSGGAIAITVVFKEFGVRLNFTPIVAGDRVHLKVRPEVSTLDFNNAITLQGFRIPSLSTRRTETELELQDGQTFAIAGLLNNTVTQSLQKVPGIGDIPILGQLFRSRAAQKERTELVVMITPQILPRNSNGVTPNLPRLQEPFLEPLPNKKSIEPPPPPFQPSRSGDAAPATSGSGVAAPVSSSAVPASSTADAARALSALTPSAPRLINSPAPAAPASQVTGDAPARPLTADEQRAPDPTQRDEVAKAQADMRETAKEAKRAAKQAEADRRQAEKERQLQETAAREQAKRDAEQAKSDAEQAKRDAEAAKKAADAAKKQAEIDRKQQKVIDEAAARLLAAQEIYQAELAKKTNGATKDNATRDNATKDNSASKNKH